MDGIINILKPTGMTSHDVVGIIRKKFSLKKVGHTGTLDPNAAGVLPICIGKATKLSQYIMEKDKVYRCEMRFGTTTDTLDSYGNVEVKSSGDLSSLTAEEIKETCTNFVGEIDQVPPSYSAIKIDGVRLYEKARRGQEIKEIPSRKVIIYNIRIVDYQYPKLMLDIECSKGTYIRSLVRDIAKSLQTKAYMSLLIRMRSGQFLVHEAVTIEELEICGIEKHLMPMESIMFPMEDFWVKSSAEKSYINGSLVSSKGTVSELNGPDRQVRVFGESSGFMGIGKIMMVEEHYYLKSETLLV